MAPYVRARRAPLAGLAESLRIFRTSADDKAPPYGIDAPLESLVMPYDIQFPEHAIQMAMLIPARLHPRPTRRAQRPRLQFVERLFRRARAGRLVANARAHLRRAGGDRKSVV